MTKKIFIDTDIGGDCDDAGALAIANILKNERLIDVVGMTFTTSGHYGPACISAINTYYGNSDIEIGATHRRNFCDKNISIFQPEIAKRFKNDFYIKESDTLYPAQEAVGFIRKKLAAEPDGSVTFLCIGQLNNVSDLLDSAPDGYSTLNGAELVKRKIDKFVVMGGLFGEEDQDFGSEAEYNIVTDIASAVNFVSKCPVEIVFSDFNVGCQIKTGGELLRGGGEDNPVALAYKLFQNAPRESWDLLALWYAALGEDDLFKISPAGRITVDGDGKTRFECSEHGLHFLIRLCNTVEYTCNKLEKTLVKEISYVK